MAPTFPTHDFYVVLEVQPGALNAEIKASYRRLALIHHPDKNNGCKKATAKTQLVSCRTETAKCLPVHGADMESRSTRPGKSSVMRSKDKSMTGLAQSLPHLQIVAPTHRNLPLRRHRSKAIDPLPLNQIPQRKMRHERKLQAMQSDKNGSILRNTKSSR